MIAIYLGLNLLVVLSAFAVFSLVRRDYQQHHRLTRTVAGLQFAIFAAYALVVQWGLVLADWLKVHASGLPLLLGLISGITGLALLVASLGVFASFRRMTGREVNSLKRSGIYRWSRNPQLLGMGFLLLGFLLIWPSWPMLISLLAFLPIAHSMVLVEEEHLRRVFGSEYDRYCEHTARYIGLPRPRRESDGSG